MGLKTKYQYEANGPVKNIFVYHKQIDTYIEISNSNMESAIVLLKGAANVILDKKYFLRRKSVFEEKASAVYLPKGVKCILEPSPYAEIVILQTPVQRDSYPLVVHPKQVEGEIRGRHGYRRRVYNIFGEKSPAIRLLVGETINFKGEWSSFPPHKHDEKLRNENPFEEIYLFKINPEDGFGLQRIYTEDGSLDECVVVKSNDIVLIPRGYHPVCVIPGYELYYLWVLVGDTKKLIPTAQEKYKWLEK